ncbi:GMC family oxidoreductase N-terminal domain-containing protein [bacterium]|nr:GMC family oxidoreductase N-terminal domain-containing protein [bacterium]
MPRLFWLLALGLCQFSNAAQFGSCREFVAQAGTDYDYIVVGSGAGGSVVASRLTQKGFRVLVVEAGAPGYPMAAQAPALHGVGSEFAPIALDYGVQHFDSADQAHRDPKFDSKLAGILYPRGEGIGGSTLVNAMISVRPMKGDFDAIAQLTGDASWSDANMLRYWTERIENNQHRPVLRGLHRVGGALGLPFLRNVGGHGFDGWLPTSQPGWDVLYETLVKDAQLRRIVLAAEKATRGRTGSIFSLARRASTFFDPNDSRAVNRREQGLTITPLAVSQGRRQGPRNLLLGTLAAHPQSLDIVTGALVGKVVFEGPENEASGVEIHFQENALGSDDEPAGENQGTLTVRAKRGVVLAAGTFETPKILKLSGIGPREELERFDIPVRADLPVGANLQDRYEVSVISQMRNPFKALEKARFATDSTDPVFNYWRTSGKGLYATNGSLISMIVKSNPRLEQPDLYIFGIPGSFPGYYQGYSVDSTRRKDIFSWVILKARNENRGGSVLLSSSDPRAQPDIRFRYFQEGTDTAGLDEEAVMNGVKFVRELNRAMDGHILSELAPGTGITSDAQIRQWVRDTAWGHHASSSASIGPVTNSRLRPHGTKKLYLADASVFPRTPGFFIAVPLYMMAEKAGDMIAEDGGQEP